MQRTYGIEKNENLAADWLTHKIFQFSGFVFRWFHIFQVRAPALLGLVAV
jgi:hypothetical protein